MVYTYNTNENVKKKKNFLNSHDSKYLISSFFFFSFPIYIYKAWERKRKKEREKKPPNGQTLIYKKKLTPISSQISSISLPKSSSSPRLPKFPTSTRFSRTITPWPGSHWKYRVPPLTLPSFLPLGSSNSSPTQGPGPSSGTSPT